jgi:hypothetical protein
MRRQQARDLRELKSAQRAVRKAKRRLKRIDRAAMTDAPERALLNGRDDLKDARAVAGEERDYLRKLDAFVSDYEKLLGYTVFSYEAQHRFSVAIVQAQVQIPARPTSLGQITGPLDRGIRRAAPAVKQFKRRRPPRPMRKEHRDVLRDLEHVLEQQRAVAAAIRRDDFDRANAIDRRVRKKADRSRKTSTEELRRFINRSRYSKQIDDLNKRELAIRKLFEDL